MSIVTLSTDELSVFGGPAEISVDLDFGAKGTRGSLIFASNEGKPENSSLPSDLQFYDLFINLKPTDDEYMYLYQYINSPTSGGTWQPLLRLIPNVLSIKQDIAFTSGIGSVEIPVTSIVPASTIANMTGADFNIQYSFANSTDVFASSVLIDEDITDGDLKFEIKAYKFDGSAWSEATGPHTIHFYISVGK